MITSVEKKRNYLNLELRGLYNWNYVNCIRDNDIRTIEDINKEIMNIVIGDNDN